MKNKDRADGADQLSQTGPDGATKELPPPRVCSQCIQSNSQNKVEMKCMEREKTSLGVYNVVHGIGGTW